MIERRPYTVKYRTRWGSDLVKCYKNATQAQAEIERLYERRLQAKAYFNGEVVGEVVRLPERQWVDGKCIQWSFWYASAPLEQRNTNLIHNNGAQA